MNTPALLLIYIAWNLFGGVLIAENDLSYPKTIKQYIIILLVSPLFLMLVWGAYLIGLLGEKTQGIRDKFKNFYEK